MVVQRENTATNEGDAADWQFMQMISLPAFNTKVTQKCSMDY